MNAPTTITPATNKTTVKFSDGTTHEFGDKEKAKKEATVTDAGVAQLKIYFRNGEFRTFELAPSHKVFARSAVHGMSQKLGDCYANLQDTDDAIAAVDKLWKAIDSGDWAAPRVSDGMAGAGLLARALHRMYPDKTIEGVREFVGTLTAKEQAAMRADSSVAKVIAEIQAEREAKKPAAEKIDVKSLLSRMPGLGSAPAPAPAPATDQLQAAPKPTPAKTKA